jgi:hypothetical protein
VTLTGWRNSAREFAHTVLAGMLLSVGIRLKKLKPVRPVSHFWGIALLGVLLSIVLQYWQLGGQPVIWQTDGLMGDALSSLLILGAATAALAMVRKQYFAFSLASLLLASQWLIALVCMLTLELVAQRSNFALVAHRLTVFSVLWFAFASWHGLRLVLRDASKAPAQANASPRAWLLVLMAATLVVLTAWPSLGPLRMQTPRYVELDRAKLYANEAALPEPAPAFDAEAVLYRQRSMVEKSLSGLRPGVAGTPELFVLALAGDAGEDTFLNEASYTQTLFEQRFGAHKRTVVLANHARSTARYPLASVTNLRAVLKGLAAQMDLEEDILFFYLASHGGPAPQHEFALSLAPMPLNQLSPAILARALNEAGITRRVVVVSACYSGGYLEALSGPQSVVITAASADRTSFGCGGDFDMTYFGRAFLLEALNQQKDFLKAFQSADASVRAREKREDILASNPQMRIGENAAAMLSEWKRSMEPGDPVPFFAPDFSQ